MPLIRIEFDNAIVKNNEAHLLSSAIRAIVSEETSIKDVFVYANSAQIKIQVAPIEIFIEMSAHKIQDLDGLFCRIKDRLSEWKTQTRFPHPINLTLIPMEWKIEIGI